MSKVKVALRVPTLGAKAGTVIEVDADVADRLVTNGHARPVAAKTAKPAKSD